MQVQGEHYRHDCGHCVAIGSFRVQDDQAYDVWYCPPQGDLIIRGGDEGGEYSSLPIALLERGQVTMPRFLVAFNLVNMHAQAEHARLIRKQARS